MSLEGRRPVDLVTGRSSESGLNRIRRDAILNSAVIVYAGESM